MLGDRHLGLGFTVVGLGLESMVMSLDSAWISSSGSVGPNVSAPESKEITGVEFSVCRASIRLLQGIQTFL